MSDFIPWMADIRRAIQDIKDAELQNLEAGVHLLPDGPRKREVRSQREKRWIELRDLLFGPVLRAAEQIGWKEEGARRQLDPLFAAAHSVLSWDVRGRCRAILTEAGRFDFGVHPEPDPRRRLLALLGDMAAALRAVAVLAGTGGQAAPAAPLPGVVDLDQIAALAHLAKRSMEAYKRRKNDPLPDPDYPGGGGRRDHWNWTTIRPWLVRNVKFPIPEDCPKHGLRG
jgi:hypothetical protein